MNEIIQKQLTIIEQAYKTGWTDKLEILFIELGRQESLLLKN